LNPGVVIVCSLLGDFNWFRLTIDDRLHQLENIADLPWHDLMFDHSNSIFLETHTWVSMMKIREAWAEALLGPDKIIRWCQIAMEQPANH
jgi:hypothetical protein